MHASLVIATSRVHLLHPREEAYRKEKVRNIVCDVHGETHVREVETIAKADQSKGDDVVRDQFLEVLARLFKLQ